MGECEHDLSLIARHERTFGEILQGIIDIREMLHHNTEEAIARRNDDVGVAREWRGKIETRLINIEAAVAEIQPNYKRMLAAMGFVMMGCLAARGKGIWDHMFHR